MEPVVNVACQTFGQTVHEAAPNRSFEVLVDDQQVKVQSQDVVQDFGFLVQHNSEWRELERFRKAEQSEHRIRGTGMRLQDGKGYKWIGIHLVTQRQRCQSLLSS